MRLHHLTVTAFGPFSGTVEVDFDELSSAGLFLLTGATGAGKTSVLDAVCFALYGQVPGDRAGAKHLRSDQASPQLAPSVALRFSVGERQLTFTRSPAWSRPKLRGKGETRVQAHVLVEELVGGDWVALTNRLDDAGLFVTTLLGMTGTQFTQVALLPQGRFQAFLRATSAERHAVLQQLFRTDRFERVERWLVDQRTASRRASEAAAAAVLDTVSRLREAAGIDEAPAWATTDLAAAAVAGQVQGWVDALATGSAHTGELTDLAAARTDQVLLDAEESLTVGRRTQELQARAAAASADLADLSARRSSLAEARRRLADHRRAVPLSGSITAAATASRAAERALAAWQPRQRIVAGLLGSAEECTRGDLECALRDAQAAETLAVAFAARAEARRVASQRLGAARARLQALETGVAEIELTISAQPGVLSEAIAAVHEARAGAARLPSVRAAEERWEGLINAARRAEVVGLELVAARTDVLAATDTAQDAKERYLEVREARINGMAGELAGQLASGCSCPVCGSAEHPSPAGAVSGGVGRDEEDRARRTSEDAAFELQARQVGLGALESELAALEERLAGVDRDTLTARRDQAKDEVERLEPLVAALEVLVAREQDCRAHLAAAERARNEALLERASVSAELDQTSALVELIDREWDALLAGPGAAPGEERDHDLATVIGLRRARAAGLAEGLDLLDAADLAGHQARTAAEALHNAARDARFPDVDTAVAALLPETAAVELDALVRDAEVRAHAAQLTLADRDVAGVLDQAPPELAVLTAAREAAAGAARRARSAHDAAVARHQRIVTLAAQMQECLDAWAPLRDRHRTITELAALVEGKSVDNPLRMRLAAYVLAERLRQVVAAANERLSTMTDQRYALEHSDDRGYGEQRGGLSLRVRDDWSGVQRDPATLSGGETFVVSLALALGLADTVAHEAGGTDIDTLFIDEGFGSLDADTLDDVMDTLDSLRDGGRVVGLVSHVPELRNRITTQLEVSKGRAGSTVRAAFTAR